MKIEVNGKKYNVNPISYSDKLELRGWFWDVFQNGENNVNHRQKGKLFAFVSKIAFNDPSKSIDSFKDEPEIVIQGIMLEYLGMSDASKKENGD